MPRSKELTFRGLVLGALITLIFTAANIYLALKIGLTFASSIPAAVISMAVLRMLGGSSILENNMVQSQASAAGTLSCVFATFPALILLGYWSSFPWLLVAGISAAGGIAGVLFTIPLRHALVNGSSLVYPEGVAAAEILRAGESHEGSEGAARRLILLLRGAALSGGMALASGGLRIISDSAGCVLTAGQAVFRFSTGFSLALVGAGYLVGLAGGLAMLLGFVLAWGIAVPWLTAVMDNPGHLAPSAFAMSVWTGKVRFIGAGTIAVAALWTLGELALPVARGVRTALSRTLSGPADTDRDLPPWLIVTTGGLISAALFALFCLFLAPATSSVILAALTGTLFFLVFGFLTAAACGYMAGLVGSSSSPISGIGLIANVLISSLLLLFNSTGLLAPVFSADHYHLAIAFTIAILSAITAASAISNDNLQDLKTGQLVGASPWKQEAVLIIGCLTGAVIIPPVLNLLYQTYGFTGALPRPDMDPTRALSAPQPALMAMIANGIFNRSLDWTMLTIGAGLGGCLILANTLLRRKKMSLPPLAAGIGLYLPPQVSLTLAIGAGIGWLVHRRHRQGEAGPGTMIASGLIVGESLTGVLLAAVAAATGRDDTLSLQEYIPPLGAQIAGGIIFIAACIWFARNMNDKRKTKS
ncbi:oligopeptide transporter, OPT family [Acetobacter sp. AN02]|uniref:OPT family oligopeptide transporter n=1 Tax=Acetobacter sp. AN02 TaxID=2894186 RepID=UPI0024341B22|nr:oligopeptide transporter, OPT family [Acetobacter sp. AN02]MDG6093828.1 oligopeptide transporter, OPT family [Acetobacter sp. AN02]